MVTLSEAPAMASLKALLMKDRFRCGPPFITETLASPKTRGAGPGSQPLGGMPHSPVQVSWNSLRSSSPTSPSILSPTSRHFVCFFPSPE